MSKPTAPTKKQPTKLTESRYRVLCAVFEFRRANKIRPTFDEVALLAEVAISTAREHALRLRDDKLVTYTPRKSRTLALTDAGRDAMYRFRKSLTKKK